MKSMIEKIEAAQLKKNIAEFRPGDTVRVDVEIIEGDSRRVQAFEGIVLRKRGHSVGATFTVRKVSFGIGVERTFPLHSPRIQGIQVIRTGKVRRARLYYLRDLSGKAARIEEKSGVVTAGETSAATPSAPVATA